MQVVVIARTPRTYVPVRFRGEPEATRFQVTFLPLNGRDRCNAFARAESYAPGNYGLFAAVCDAAVTDVRGLVDEQGSPVKFEAGRFVELMPDEDLVIEVGRAVWELGHVTAADAGKSNTPSA